MADRPIFAFFPEDPPCAQNGRLVQAHPYQPNWIDRSASHSAFEFLKAVRKLKENPRLPESYAHRLRHTAPTVPPLLALCDEYFKPVQ